MFVKQRWMLWRVGETRSESLTEPCHSSVSSFRLMTDWTSAEITKIYDLVSAEEPVYDC